MLSVGTLKSAPYGVVAVSVGAYTIWRRLLRANRYRLTLDATSFVVRSGPVPGPQFHKATTDIDCFKSVQYTGFLQARGKPRWEVLLLAADGRTTVLPLAVNRLDHADFVAAALNDLLAQARQPKTYRG